MAGPLPDNTNSGGGVQHILSHHTSVGHMESSKGKLQIHMQMEATSLSTMSCVTCDQLPGSTAPVFDGIVPKSNVV